MSMSEEVQENTQETVLGEKSVPAHIAIIMDGNSRWAKKRLMPSVAGHRAGAAAVRRVVEIAAKENVKVLTLFAFSSENWRRPKAEVDALMVLFMRMLKKEVKRLKENNIRLRIMGDVTGFSAALQKQIVLAEEETRAHDGLQLVIAANYGGRWDIAEAAKTLCQQVIAGELALDDIDEHKLSEQIQLADLPEPDLIIRTSGEQRISNFMLWQAAYSEFVFLPVLWPDFDESDFNEAVGVYQQRQRRYGGR